MVARVASRIEPAPAILDAARRWLAPVRTALGSDFLSCYLTGSVLRHGFDPRKSRVNLLVVSRGLGLDVLDRVAKVWPADERRPPHFEPLFMSEAQVRQSLDAFPIEWIEIHEAHLLLEGHDVVGSLTVPRDNLRLQCEHELRVKALRLRHRYLASARQPQRRWRVVSPPCSGRCCGCVERSRRPRPRAWSSGSRISTSSIRRR
jgi:hypothetical protein